MKTQNVWTKVAGMFLMAFVLGLLIFYPHYQQRVKKISTDKSFHGRLLGAAEFRNLEIGLMEYTISTTPKGYEIELRDRRVCHGSTNPEDACTAITWNVGFSGKFISREEYHFQNGSKIWLGRIDSVGSKEDYYQVASYGIGNPIPYVFQTYRDDPKDRRVYLLQEQVNNVLKDIPPAA